MEKFKFKMLKSLKKLKLWCKRNIKTKLKFICWDNGRTPLPSWCNRPYYMASSASGQNEPNRALWLATRAGKMEPFCPLGTTRCIPQEKFPRKPYNNPLLTKFVRSRWLDIGLVLFFVSLWTETQSRSINTQKRTWPISSHLDPTLGQ